MHGFLSFFHCNHGHVQTITRILSTTTTAAAIIIILDDQKCTQIFLTFNELRRTNDRLFHKLCSNTGHLLHYLLPPPTTTSQHYNLRCTSTDNTVTSTHRPPHRRQLHHTFILQRLLPITELLSQCEILTLYFTRRIVIVTAIRFVIVDFKRMNE